MRKIKAILTFYLISFAGIYAIDFLMESKSEFSIEISKRISGQNGLAGLINIAVLVTVIGGIVLLIARYSGIFDTMKNSNGKTFWKYLKVLFLGKQEDTNS